MKMMIFRGVTYTNTEVERDFLIWSNQISNLRKMNMMMSNKRCPPLVIVLKLSFFILDRRGIGLSCGEIALSRL